MKKNVENLVDELKKVAEEKKVDEEKKASEEIVKEEDVEEKEVVTKEQQVGEEEMKKKEVEEGKMESSFKVGDTDVVGVGEDQKKEEADQIEIAEKAEVPINEVKTDSEILNKNVE
ncbi:hypothetical protein Hanom_Chr06g00530341 [Helianthus anomalus]